jgi:hypothetical protein
VNVAGWVQLRRGILDHLHEGKLSNNEFLVLVVLIMLADKKTGAGTINAPALRYFIPELEYDAAKRVLHSLEEKRYIYRKIKPYSKIVYPYWVNRYAPSVGLHKGLQIDLTKVFQSKDVNDIAYINHAPDDAPQGAPEGAPDPAPNYKKEEVRQEKGNKTSISKNESASICASSDEAKSSIAQAEAQRNMQRASALPSALPSKAQSETTAVTSPPQTNAQPDISRMSAEDYFKHIGQQLPSGDWNGITADQFLSFDPRETPREQFWDAQLKWIPNRWEHRDMDTDKHVSWPDAIRRILRVRPPQPQSAA